MAVCNSGSEDEAVSLGIDLALDIDVPTLCGSCAAKRFRERFSKRFE